MDLIRQVREFALKDEVCIDNIVFRLHSRVTVLMLALCLIVVGSKSYFGEPMSCFLSSGGYSIPSSVVNSYCWVSDTFTVSRYLRGIPGQDNAGPGIGPGMSYSNGEGTIDQRYYKWVCFVLAVQAIAFYTPRALWGVWERNIVQLLTRDLDVPIAEAWTAERKTQLIDYFVNSNEYSHNFYAIRLLICEVMNLLISIYFLDLFLEGQFSLYGPAAMMFATTKDVGNMVNPMTQLFPLGGKCTFYYYGPSGSVQILDALCVLPLNIVNEKIFIFFWFWYIFLSFAGILGIIYRFIIFTQPWARLYLMRAQTRLLLRTKLDNIVRKLNFGDWFLLYQLAENVNPIVYRELINEIGTAVSSKHFESLA